MTDTRAFPPWGQAWMDMQRQYWDAWKSIYQQGLESAADAATDQQRSSNTPWSSALDNWWKMASTTTPPQAHGFIGKMVEQGKSFLQLGEEIAKLQEGMVKSTEGWQDALNARFTELKETFSKADASGATRGLMAFWELPLDTWQRTVSSASVLPGDFLESVKSEQWEQARDGFQQRFERFLSVPALGYSREWQEQGQELARLAMNYQRALQEYADTFRWFGVETLTRLQQTILERAEQQKPITSLRTLYDLWVDAGEEVYMELVNTEEYAALYGRLMNALMALKHRGRDMVDESLGAFGMPTSKALNTVLRRQQETRRELMALRRELERVRADVGGDGIAKPRSAVRRAAAGRRKTATRKSATRKAAAKRSRSHTRAKGGR